VSKSEHPADKAARKDDQKQKAESAAARFKIVQRRAGQGKHPKGYIGKHRKQP
jgi:hypothetical protein